MSGMPAPPNRRGGVRRAGEEAGVIKTNDDAQATKLSCASLGYFTDAVLPLLHKALPSRKPPIINRGTWARHAVMAQVTHDFITACTQAASTCSSRGHISQGSSEDSAAQVICQVVVLGAGTDSTWFNLQHKACPLLHAAHFIEVDFQEVVSKKARTVLSTPQLLQLLPEGTSAVTTPVAASQTDNHHDQRAAATSPLDLAALQAEGITGGAAPACGGSAAQDTHMLTWTKPAPTSQQAASTADTQSPQQHPSNTPISSVHTSSQDIQCPPPPPPPPQQQQQQQQQQGQTCHVSARQPAATCTAAACMATQHPVQHHVSATPPPPLVVQHHVQELHGPLFSLVAADIRDQGRIRAALTRAGHRPQLPTLFLCECVLVYLDPEQAAGVLSTAAALAAEGGGAAAVAIYEQTRPDDPFGTIMTANLEARGCPLRSLSAVPTPAAQATRLTNTGWTSTAAADMAAIYSSSSSREAGGGRVSVMSHHMMTVDEGVVAGGCGAARQEGGWLRPDWEAERSRIERLEFLDELEEWQLLQEHYCLALGTVGDYSPTGWLAEALQLRQLAALCKHH